ncbi:hypothetical protein CNECB9_640005 [Cupriavidus necator]|uniref:Uncharacterized protein n=1 Tax=Cupriavidus necator TaxID=106590 RepID=A0A1K0JYV6_CUPNE|nr:hypothetical protein CNECB9_640005 [Cupriavidus necator]
MPGKGVLYIHSSMYVKWMLQKGLSAHNLRRRGRGNTDPAPVKPNRPVQIAPHPFGITAQTAGSG